MPLPQITIENVIEIKRGATLRQVEIICLVSKVGSITLAANLLNMTAANVSRTCQRFDDHFTFDIFKKKRKGIELTEEGKEILVIFSQLNQCIETTAARLTGER